MVSEVLTTAWEMTNAQAKLDRSKKTRIEILEEAAQGQCASGCNGEWLTCASEVLGQNQWHSQRGIRNRNMRIAGEREKKKFALIMICGQANPGKAFSLNSLTSIYADTFSNPCLHVICMGWSGRCRM